MDSNQVSRTHWADVCRILATFGVILVHTSGPIFYQYGKIDQFDWLSAHFINSLVRCSVPLFVMLSGALLLQNNSREITLSELYKRVMRIAIPLLTWNLFYMVFLSYHTGSSIDVLSMLHTPAMYHLTFLYTLIGVYLLIPILQVIFKLLVSRKDLQVYFLSGWFIVTCIPVFKSIPFISSTIGTDYVGWAGYFLIGGVIGHYFKNGVNLKKWHLLIALITYVFSVAVTFTLTWMLSSQANSPIQIAYEYFSPNVFFAAISVFIFIINIQVNDVTSKVLQWVSNLTFPVYFMHVVVLDIVHVNIITPEISMPISFQVFSTAFISFIICLFVTSVLRLIPKSKAIFG